MELVNELALYERAPEEVTVTMQHFEESGFGPKPVWWAFVVEEDGIIQGFALWYVRYSTWKGQAMYLEDLLVTEKMRGRGAGKMLFDALIAEARKQQLNRIIWQVLSWNEPAINFYRKLDTSFDEGWINCQISVPQ